MSSESSVVVKTYCWFFFKLIIGICCWRLFAVYAYASLGASLLGNQAHVFTVRIGLVDDVSVDWLYDNLKEPNMKLLDASWYMPDEQRNPIQEYQAAHIPMALFFGVIDIMRSPPEKKLKTGIFENWDARQEPNIVVYNAVLNACVKQKQWKWAFWVLQQLKKQGLQPSTVTYGLVMEKSSIPNSLTYRVPVNTFWKERKTDEAISGFQEMERRGIVGCVALYYDLARCLCVAGRGHEALMQIDKICKVGNKPLVVTYTGLMQASLDSGHIQDEAYIFEKMKEICAPNLVTCNRMLKLTWRMGCFKFYGFWALPYCRGTFPSNAWIDWGFGG
ncbi:Tetratricopeptide-like helical domain superfamily [Sesbania bispinosa]|nr:Tetratricopeptide-like helical domain superfamily [Sesbania bispinosa]